jgi:hypothetical protein
MSCFNKSVAIDLTMEEEYNMKKATILLTLLFLLNLNTIDVHADSADYDTNDVIENMKSVNSSQEDIDSVLEKLEKGETLDSDKNLEELSLQIEKSDLQLSQYGILDTTSFEDESVEFIRYEDGSFQKLTLEVENPNNDMISILSSNGAIRRFRPSITTPFGNASFNANIFIPNDTRNNSYISSVSNHVINTNGGTYSNAALRIVNPTEIQGRNVPASGRLTWDFTLFGDWAKRSTNLTIESGHHIGGQFGVRVTSRSIGVTSY